jgi:hypothetical protein
LAAPTSTSGEASGLAAIAAAHAASSSSGDATGSSAAGGGTAPTRGGGGGGGYNASLPMTGAELTLNAAQLRLLFPRDNTIQPQGRRRSNSSERDDKTNDNLKRRQSMASIEAAFTPPPTVSPPLVSSSSAAASAATTTTTASKGNNLTVVTGGPPSSGTITPERTPNAASSGTLMVPIPSPHLTLAPPGSSGGSRRRSGGNVGAAVAEALASSSNTGTGTGGAALTPANVVHSPMASSEFKASFSPHGGGGSGPSPNRASINNGPAVTAAAVAASPRSRSSSGVKDANGAPVAAGSGGTPATGAGSGASSTPTTPGGNPRRLLSRISEIIPMPNGAADGQQPIDYRQLMLLRRLNANESASSNPIVLQELMEETDEAHVSSSVAQLIKKPKWWLIDADSRAKMIWDFIMIVLLIYSIIVVPINIAFG